MGICPYCNFETNLLEKHKASCKLNPEFGFTEEAKEVNEGNKERII